jgi:hypothetical protein
VTIGITFRTVPKAVLAEALHLQGAQGGVGGGAEVHARA